MSELMELFNSELTKFRDGCEKNLMEVRFDGDVYPPRIEIKGGQVWEQQSFDGVKPTEKKLPHIIVKGGVDTVVNYKNLAMRKRDASKIVGTCEKLLQLWLHAFCQENLAADSPDNNR